MRPSTELAVSGLLVTIGFGLAMHEPDPRHILAARVSITTGVLLMPIFALRRLVGRVRTWRGYDADG